MIVPSPLPPSSVSEAVSALGFVPGIRTTIVVSGDGFPVSASFGATKRRGGSGSVALAFGDRGGGDEDVEEEQQLLASTYGAHAIRVTTKARGALRGISRAPGVASAAAAAAATSAAATKTAVTAAATAAAAGAATSASSPASDPLFSELRTVVARTSKGVEIVLAPSYSSPPVPAAAPPSAAAAVAQGVAASASAPVTAQATSNASSSSSSSSSRLSACVIAVQAAAVPSRPVRKIA